MALGGQQKHGTGQAMLALEFKNKKKFILGHTLHYIPGCTNLILGTMCSLLAAMWHEKDKEKNNFL